MSKPQLRGFTALVTGASSGIGLAIAYELACRGANLILVSNEPAQLRRHARTLQALHGVRATPVGMDLASPEAAARLWRRFGKSPVDILVNNAGIFFWGEVPDIPADRVRLMVNLHVLTPSLLCAYFCAPMRKRGRGFVLNVSSMIVYKDFPGLAHYGGTKSYLKTYTEALRSEMQEYGVKVTSLRPGAVDTNLYHSRIGTRWALRLGVMLKPEAVARAAVSGLLRGKAVVVPGLLTKLLVTLVPLAPRALIDLIKNRTHLVPRKPPG